MSYKNLIFDIFKEDVQCITEEDFCMILPELFDSIKTTKWTQNLYADLIKLRYGLQKNEKHTLREVGIILFGISAERIRQRQCKALRVFRQQPQSVRIRIIST